ncbi:Uncharacterised protein [Raoultella terrigena]|nr:Uncharacterised protein [Raoultella terrigena]
MTILNRLYASSGSEVIIETLQWFYSPFFL